MKKDNAPAQENQDNPQTITLTPEQLQELVQKQVAEAMKASTPAPALAPIVQVVTGKNIPQDPPQYDSQKIIDYLNERVPYRAFKDNDKYKDDLVIVHNGKIWQIQRGKNVMIPRYLFNLISDHEKQMAEAANYQLALMQEYEQRKNVLEK